MVLEPSRCAGGVCDEFELSESVELVLSSSSFDPSAAFSDGGSDGAGLV